MLEVLDSNKLTMNYNNVLFRISQDESIAMQTRRFANLFRYIIVITIRETTNKQMTIFADVCRSVITIYYHRLVQVINNTLDPEKSILDYEELEEIVTSIHHEIKTNTNPIQTRDRIVKQLSLYC